MATNGTKIIDGDTAHDTYWGIMDLYDSGVPLETIVIEFPLQQKDYYDSFDNEIYVTSCGLAYWELGLMNPKRLKYIKEIIQKDACVKEWTSYSEKEGKSRKSVLKRYLTKIEKNNEKIRKQKKYRKISNFVVPENTVLNFQLSNGLYAVTCCIKIDQYRGNCHYWLVPITYTSTSAPTMEQILQSEILGRTIPSSFSRTEMQIQQPGIEKIWAYAGGNANFCFGFVVEAIEHKDFIKIKDQFKKVGTLNLINGIKKISSLSYTNSYESYDNFYTNLETNIKTFRYQKFPVKIVLAD